jgi:hypothetical protein
MTDTERRLAELENMHRAMVRDGENRRRMMAKSFAAGRYAGNTRRRAPDFGKAGTRHVSEQPVDLVKAQLTLNHLHRTGKLTDEQAGKAQSRLMALRPTQVISLE